MNVVQLLYYECSSAIMNVVQTVGTISTSFHVIYQGFLRIDKTNPVYTGEDALRDKVLTSFPGYRAPFVSHEM